jgi:hypothetical protein
MKTEITLQGCNQQCWNEMCEHGRQKKDAKECGGGICEHSSRSIVARMWKRLNSICEQSRQRKRLSKEIRRLDIDMGGRRSNARVRRKQYL